MDLHPAAHSAALSARTTFRPLSRCFYLRRLLINGASANLLRSKATKADPWVIGIRRRRPPLVVAVALANKLRGFQRKYVRRVRLIQQHGEFAEHGIRLRDPGDLNAFL